MTIALLFLVAGLAVAGWVAGRARARVLACRPGEPRFASLPGQYGWAVALAALAAAAVAAAGWSAAAPSLIENRVLAAPAAAALPSAPMARAALLAEVRDVGDGRLPAAFHPLAARLAPVHAAAAREMGLIGLGIVLVAGFAGGAAVFACVGPRFRARTHVERVVMALLLAASLIAIVTTLGIVLSLVVEASRFFARVSPAEFLFGTHWSPQEGAGPDGQGAFGAIPLFWGTIFIGAIIAMAVAIPLGLMSAIYLTQYARAATRRWVKPVLEILAGVPTVVYGYFAALTVAPALARGAGAVGIAGASAESALAAGLVMGVMIIPFVSSMADDSLAAVPQAMRDGSLAMGATMSETICRVLVPAALPGIVGGVLLAVSRAIGETMIVVMAAGLSATLTANPFASVTTVTAQIVQLLTGDQEFDSPRTLAAFALGLVLFLVTLALNIVALRVVKAYREAYE
ncbi:MAG: phosphate ABC transporter permease subunit PstC [Sphingomonas fennica]